MSPLPNRIKGGGDQHRMSTDQRKVLDFCGLGDDGIQPQTSPT